VAQGPSGQLFVPFTLPGELVKVEVAPDKSRAEALAILEPSPERIAPVCQYFGTCGGCALQHMDLGSYLAWKREQVVAALASRGLGVPVEEVRAVPLASRRRGVFSLGRTARGVALGYRGARSHGIVDIAACPVLSPGLASRLPKLKAALTPLLGGKREARITVTEIGEGLDLVVEGIRPSPSLLAKLAAAGAGIGAARITVGEECVILAGEPTVRLSGAEVRLPPGAFLQASREAEAALVGLVKQGAGRSKRVADLFAGIGTFTFALAKGAEVDAFEQDESAIAALGQAARATPKLKPGPLPGTSSAPLSPKPSLPATTPLSSIRRAPAPRRRLRLSLRRRCRRSRWCRAIQAPARGTCASSSTAATASHAWCRWTSSCSRRISSSWSGSSGSTIAAVMAGLVPAIYVFGSASGCPAQGQA
jgi:23S rRNA (uracil1939-C5)-methyltransferase